MARKCPVCGNKKIVLNEDGYRVCVECGSVVGQMWYRLRPKVPRSIQQSRPRPHY